VGRARAEARGEAEAAAEQRLAAALALEHAELDKQVQLNLLVRQCSSDAPPWPAFAECACARQWLRRPHVLCRCGSMGRVKAELSGGEINLANLVYPTCFMRS
jgi:hypothetical protein